MKKTRNEKRRDVDEKNGERRTENQDSKTRGDKKTKKKQGRTREKSSFLFCSISLVFCFVFVFLFIFLQQQAARGKWMDKSPRAGGRDGNWKIRKKVREWRLEVDEKKKRFTRCVRRRKNLANPDGNRRWQTVGSASASLPASRPDREKATSTEPYVATPTNRSRRRNQSRLSTPLFPVPFPPTQRVNHQKIIKNHQKITKEMNKIHKTRPKTTRSHVIQLPLASDAPRHQRIGAKARHGDLPFNR